MTYTEALSQISYATGARNQLYPEGFLTVCETCEQALLQEVARMLRFNPAVEPASTVEGSHMHGCTLRVGPVDACVLRLAKHEESVCRL